MHVSTVTMCEVLRAIVGSYVWRLSFFDRKGSILPPLCGVTIKKKKRTAPLELSPCHFPFDFKHLVLLRPPQVTFGPFRKKKNTRSGKILHVLLKEVEFCCLCVWTSAYEKRFNRRQRQRYFPPFSSMKMKLLPSFLFFLKTV